MRGNPEEWFREQRPLYIPNDGSQEYPRSLNVQSWAPRKMPARLPTLPCRPRTSAPLRRVQQAFTFYCFGSIVTSWNVPSPLLINDLLESGATMSGLPSPFRSASSSVENGEPAIE